MVIKYNYAEVEKLLIQKNNKVRANYLITELGENQFSKIIYLSNERKRYKWIKLIMKILDIYGSTVITKLVYNEPNFVLTRKQNRSQIDFSIEKNLSLSLISNLSSELNSNFSYKLDTLSSKIIVYFNFLFEGINKGVQ